MTVTHAFEGSNPSGHPIIYPVSLWRHKETFFLHIVAPCLFVPLDLRHTLY